MPIFVPGPCHVPEFDGSDIGKPVRIGYDGYQLQQRTGVTLHGTTYGIRRHDHAYDRRRPLRRNMHHAAHLVAEHPFPIFRKNQHGVHADLAGRDDHIGTACILPTGAGSKHTFGDRRVPEYDERNGLHIIVRIPHRNLQGERNDHIGIAGRRNKLVRRKGEFGQLRRNACIVKQTRSLIARTQGEKSCGKNRCRIAKGIEQDERPEGFRFG